LTKNLAESNSAQHDNTFRLAMSHGQEYLLQAGEEADMNQWVSFINWAAASKTLGIPTTTLTHLQEEVVFRSSGMSSNVEVEGSLTPKLPDFAPLAQHQSHRMQHQQPGRQTPDTDLGGSPYLPVSNGIRHVITGGLTSSTAVGCTGILREVSWLS
jgi:hypothetical protein